MARMAAESHRKTETLAAEHARLRAVLADLGSTLLKAGVPLFSSSMKGMIEQRMEVRELPRPAILEQVEHNARARDAFIGECGGLLTSEEVARLAGSEAGNRAQLAHRWKKDGRIFAVQFKGEQCYPAFQFDAKQGRPKEPIGKLINILGRYHDGWSLALWFSSANDWLDGKRPIDLLDRKPEAVVEAAKAEMAMLHD